MPLVKQLRAPQRPHPVAAKRFAGCLLGLLFLVGCGSRPPSDPIVSIAPAAVQLQADLGQQKFVATVQNSPNAGVVWKVNHLLGGNAAYGRISPAGLYTAPALQPQPAQVIVTAVSMENSNSRASAQVAITPAVSVTLSPASASVVVRHTLQFTATVSNATNTAVTWSVNGATGGSAADGTIDASGFYTAPAVYPGLGQITITAISVQDPKQSATAAVSLENGVQISISPTQATLNLGASLGFSATVANTSNTAVTWSVNGVNGGNSGVGIISADGVYTAPSALPSPASVTVTVTSQADPTASASASVQLTLPPGSFSLAPVSTSLTLAKAASASLPLTLSVADGFASTITLAATTALPNVTTHFDQNQFTASGTANLTIATASISLAATNAPITITASATVNGADQVATATVLLTITGWRGSVHTLAGGPGGIGFQDGAGAVDELQAQAITSDGSGTLYFLDAQGYALRSADLASGSITTLIGSPYTFPFQDGEGLALDTSSHTFYVSDARGNKIRRFAGGANAMTILAGGNTAGYADGVGTAALFNSPHAIALSPDRTTLYVADTGNDLIRAINIATEAVSTLAGQPGVAKSLDGVGAAAAFCQPWGLAIDPSGAALYISDRCSNQIRKLNLATSTVTTLAGSVDSGYADGSAASARFSYLHGLAVDPHNGALLYIADANRIRALTLTGNPVVFTLAGNGGAGETNGSGSQASFYAPRALTVIPDLVGASTSSIFVADSANGLLRRIDLANPLTANSTLSANASVSTLAGQPSHRGYADGAGTGAGLNSASVAEFDSPSAVVTDGKTAYVTDSNNGAIRAIDLATTDVSTLAGPGYGDADGPGALARFRDLRGLALDAERGMLYIADTGNNQIRKLDLSTNTVSTVAGTGAAGDSDGVLASASFNLPYGIAVSADGTKLYVADTGNNAIRLINLNAGTVSTLAGGTFGANDGIGAAASFNAPVGVALDPSQTTLYISDYGNHTIRALSLATNTVTTIAGRAGVCGDVDGVGAGAELCTPALLATDGRTLFWGESGVGLVRCLNLSTLQVSSLAGAPALLHMADGDYDEIPGDLVGPVRYNQVFDVAVAPDASFLLFADRTANSIRIVQ